MLCLPGVRHKYMFLLFKLNKIYSLVPDTDGWVTGEALTCKQFGDEQNNQNWKVLRECIYLPNEF